MAKLVPMKKKVDFTLSAPDAQQVSLAADFNGWESHPINLKRLKNGQWKATVTLEPGTYQYRYLVDGQWRDDPQCSSRVPNPFGAENCIRVVD